jgi:hypothetical protein
MGRKRTSEDFCLSAASVPLYDYAVARVRGTLDLVWMAYGGNNCYPKVVICKRRESWQNWHVQMSELEMRSAGYQIVKFIMVPPPKVHLHFPVDSHLETPF